MLSKPHSYITKVQENEVHPANDAACRRADLQREVSLQERPLILDNAILETGGKVLD
tara:strand:- start:610 stop:780 length:171 start_codon:yes stop_codon:yes gene_type:complete